MLNLSHNIVNPINEFDSITQVKHKPSKENLIILRPEVKNNYDEYLINFKNIQNKSPHTFTSNESDELRNCYVNPTSPLNKLKAKIINAQTDTFKFICPYCLIINHTTFDHYIPKEEFPVYSVCSKNLIPCCSFCNGKKNQFWRENGNRTIIHFYNDIIPQQQFLYCDINFNDQIPIVIYYLKFQPNFNSDLKYIIENHYNKLDLINRYNENIPSVLSNIETDYNSLVQFKPSNFEVSNFLISKANEYYLKFGKNYWQAIAYETLAKSKKFLKILCS